MMDTEIGAVRPEFLSRHGEFDGLQEHVTRGPGHRLVRRGPVPEGKKPDLLHVISLARREMRGADWVAVVTHGFNRRIPGCIDWARDTTQGIDQIGRASCRERVCQYV